VRRVRTWAGIIFAETEKYAGKILVAAGTRPSAQYHNRKDETLYLYRGA